jgi:hypothetical protein
MINFKEQFILFSKLDFTHFSYFSDHPQEERNAWLWMSKTANSYLIVEADDNFQCFTKEGAIVLGVAHRDSYVLLGDANLKPTCAPPDKLQWFTTHAPGTWQN